MPSRGVTLGAAAAFGAAGVAVGACSHGRGGAWTRRAARLATFALLARGTVGPVFDFTGPGAGTRFARLDLRVYAPLCLVLGGAAAAGTAAG